MDQEITDERRINFYNSFKELLEKKGRNSQIFSKETYLSIIQEVKNAKNKQRKKTPKDYQRLKRYDIITEEGEERLILPLSVSKSIRYYVCTEEIFQILHDSHMDHKGRNKMVKELNLKYKNITREMISLYIKQCSVCQNSKDLKESDAVVLNDKSLKSNRNIDARCQVDVIEMKLTPDDQYGLILVYQDLLTKFIEIRPLKTKEAKEVANVLLEIMTTLGAPSILQSENGRRFSKHVVTELRAIWPVLEIHGEYIQPQKQGPNKNLNLQVTVQNMILSWLKSNGWDKWSNGLSFVQLTYNATYDAGLKCSPYEAMFGRKVKIGIKDFIPTIPLHSEGFCENQDVIIKDEPAEFAECSQREVESSPQIKVERKESYDTDKHVEDDIFDDIIEFSMSPKHNYDLPDIKEEEPDIIEPEPKKIRKE